jgi:hypothetical protein
MPLDQTPPGGPNDDQIDDFIRQYRSQRRVCDEENGVLRALVKRAKVEGVNTSALIALVRATKRDPDAVTADLRDFIRYANILKMPLKQADLFDGWHVALTPSSRAADDLWEAGDLGYKNGRHGHPLTDSPYPPGTPLHDAYIAYWQKGQAAIARELGERGEQITAERGAPDDDAPVAPRAASPGAPRQPRLAAPAAGNGSTRRSSAPRPS